MATNGREFSRFHERKIMKPEDKIPASETEINYVRTLSRDMTIEAYKKWTVLSKTEKLLVENYISGSDCILDLGCGTGRIPQSININRENYLGIDCSLKMINAARIMHPEYKFICEDFLSSNTEYGLFDAVLLMNNVVDMLHPIKRRNNAFNEVKRYLKSSGVLIFSSHILQTGCNAGYFQEEYHGTVVNTYRSTFSQLCQETESYGFEINLAARDYRASVADWIYIVATPKS